MRALLLVVLCCGLLLAAAPAPAQAAPAGACYAGTARADASHAYRAYIRAAKRYREARHVLASTRYYSGLYGSGVGRWVRLARRSGYCWSEMGVLMRVVDRETGGTGDPTVPNLQGSGALGLLQVMPEWADGSKDWYWKQWGLPALWDRTDAPDTLRHTVHMAWSNWGE